MRLYILEKFVVFEILAIHHFFYWENVQLDQKQTRYLLKGFLNINRHIAVLKELSKISKILAALRQK